MTNTNWSETDLDAAADRVGHAVSRRLRGRRRLRRGALVTGVVALGVTGVAAASTLLPPQTTGEVYAGPQYLTSVSSCLEDAGWNVWVAPTDGGPDADAETVHFSVNGREQLRFSDDIERCRIHVARGAGVDVAEVIGLR
jgi:hypothetical protein